MIGGRRGAIALLAAVLLLGFPHAAATFQQGNFQITAVPLAAVAFILLMVGRHAAGGSLLAYAALAKIFPGILVVPLLAAREWKRSAWVAGASVALLGLTGVVQGGRTFRDFVATSLPEITSGAAFPQTEMPAHSRVNWSAYGETVRLRHLGVTSMTQRRGLAVAQVYGVCIVACPVPRFGCDQRVGGEQRRIHAEEDWRAGAERRRLTKRLPPADPTDGYNGARCRSSRLHVSLSMPTAASS